MHVWSRGSDSHHRCGRREDFARPFRPEQKIGRHPMMQAQLAQGQSPLLAVRDVSVVFGGIIALNGVSFDMHKGAILGLIGPNGAGKTTLFNCLSRLYQPSTGDILMEGQSILTRPPHRIAEIGIGRTFQNVALFPNLSVLDNVTGRHPCPHQQRHHLGLAETGLGPPRRGRTQQEGPRDRQLSRPRRRRPHRGVRAAVRHPEARRAGARAGGRAEDPAARRARRRPQPRGSPRARRPDPAGSATTVT